MDDTQQPGTQLTGDGGEGQGNIYQPPPRPFQPVPPPGPDAPQYGQQGQETQGYSPPPPQEPPPGNYQPPPQGYLPPIGYPPKQGYYGQPPPPPPRKRGLPVWVWLLPLLLLLVMGVGVVTWMVLSAQDKTASEQRAAGTSTAQAVASSTANVRVAATRRVRQTQTAEAKVDVAATEDARFSSTMTAIAGPFETETPEVTTLEPERMPLDEFKQLYDDPAARPLIVDVRGKPAYEGGHIAGSVNIPLFDLGSSLGDLPKDKLIVAYCQ